MPTPEFTPIPAFADNYFWVLHAGQDAVVVDPGDAAPVRAVLRSQRLRLAGILVTHHHADHVGGIADLLADRPVPVWGPAAEATRIPGLTQPLADGDRVVVDALGLELETWAVPGHTRGHVAFVQPHGPAPFALVGDTLFKAGCGRLFEGTPPQLHASLSRLAALPPQTAVYCAHEYTLANLRFAAAVEPDNADIALETARVQQLRARGLPSLPSTIELERRTNPFLRCAVARVRAAAERQCGATLGTPEAVFGAVRKWKDDFRP